MKLLHIICAIVACELGKWNLSHVLDRLQGPFTSLWCFAEEELPKHTAAWQAKLDAVKGWWLR